jgi:ankyrin repeat protein
MSMQTVADKSNDPNYLLMQAVTDGAPSDVRTALEAGADIRFVDGGGDSMLLRAAFHNPNRETSEFLLECGLDIRSVGDFGRTCLHSYAKNGWSDLVARALDGGASVDIEDHDGVTPIQSAVAQSNAAVVELLLERGAALEQISPQGMSLLDLAHADVCRLLVERGLSVDDGDSNDQTALYDAAWNGDVAKVQALISLGADLEKRTVSLEETALFCAARLEKAQCVVALLDAGAKTDASPYDISKWATYRRKPGNAPVIDAFYARRAMRNAREAGKMAVTSCNT